MGDFDITPVIKEQDIHVDTVADSYIDDYPEYGDINVDDPEKYKIFGKSGHMILILCLQ